MSAPTSENNNNRPRVLMLATSYPLGPQDSSSVFLRYLAEHLHKQGAEVHVLAPAVGAGGHAVEDGIHVHRFRYLFKPLQKLCYGSGILPNLKRNPLLWLTVPFFLNAFLLAALLAALRLRPTVVHGHWVVPTGVVGLVVARLLEIPFVITAHGGDAFSVKSGLMSRIKQFVIRRADAWTANTGATAAAITQATGNSGNRHIIPMGVDTQLFAPGARQGEAGSEPKRILFIGRLVEKKGVTVLLDAIARLPETTRQSMRLDIIGEGDEKPRLQQQARDLKIESLVNFVGYVANNELPRFLQQADLFVGPSIVDSVGDTEGQGVVFIEAMACGVPVIASRVGGIAEVIEDGSCGALVEPGDAAALSSAMQSLLDDEEKRLRYMQRGLQVVHERFAWERVAGSFIELYRKL